MILIRAAKGKKGISVYVSWVLVVTFVVMMSVFMFNFMRGFAERQTEQIKERALNPLECDSVGLTVDYACQDTQDLYINMTNRGDNRIDGAIFRTYDLYYEPQTDEKEFELLIGRYNAKEITLVKRGAIKKVRYIEVVPFMISGDTKIICENRLAVYPVVKGAIDDCLGR